MTEDIVSTGVAGLDVILDGGLPRRQAIVVTGEPGSGKTILCSQMAFSFAARGMPVVIATVTSEPHEKLVAALRGFSFFDPARVGEEVFFVSAYPWLKKSPKEAREMLLAAVRERGAKMLFIDGLRSIRDLWQNEPLLREFLYDLNVGLSVADCIGLFSTEYPLARLLELPEATTVDGIVSMSTFADGARSFRRAEVHKLRGRAHKAGTHVATIGKEGVNIIPRLESVVQPADRAMPPSDRLSFGLVELDALLNGGLPRNSTTLVAGSTGVGKTLLAAHFVAAGVEAGERSLVFSFFEPPANIIQRARRVGLDLEEAIASGQVQIEYHPPLEWEADVMVDHILRSVRERKVTRLVIDSVVGLEQTISDKTRASSFYNALVVALRGLGVTTLLTKEVSKLAGPELDFSDTPITVAIENFVFLRFVELRGRLHRILSVLKMRDSEYDGDVREFSIAEAGFRVLAPVSSAEGLLTGMARAVGTSVAPEGARE
ncbi:MAG: Circadian clock protein KaiC [Myxococcales bacterium]|nr:Circadian clock protein KaiC [Myxococcales bacterium]